MACDVEQLAEDAKCFDCLSEGARDLVELELLCQIYQASLTKIARVGVGDPNGAVTATGPALYTQLNDAGAIVKTWTKPTGSTGSTGWI